MTTLEVLIAARALIKNPADWCVDYIRSEQLDGSIKRCARGAILAALDTKPSPYFEFESAEKEPAMALVAHMPGSEEDSDPIVGLCCWNNSHTHPQVIAAFDRAIEAERKAKVS